jgi:hypothetical protein
MHILLIMVLLILVFPGFARLVGSVLSAVGWLVGALVVLALLGALSH